MHVLQDELVAKIKILSDTVWDSRAKKLEVDRWLNNFDDDDDDANPSERLHALYILSQFMYFSTREVRELIKSVYRDLYKYPIVETVRKSNNDTTDIELINKKYKEEIIKTRFLGVGNPSESGSHLLYYFRQENGLSKKVFINAHEIFDYKVEESVFSDPDIKRYVFIDDFCGAGTQAKRYCKQLVERIKRVNPEVDVWYFVLFARQDGLDFIQNETEFDKCDAVYKFDETYKCFGDKSRYVPEKNMGLDWGFAETMAKKYGLELESDDPLGHDDCQMLISFFHNTPNNTLPIIWYDNQDKSSWEPIFRRYPKIYGSTR